MLELKGQTLKGLTLALCYGSKNEIFSGWYQNILDKLAAHLGAALIAYRLLQVHATVVGLEGIRRAHGVLNQNFLDRARGDEAKLRPMNFDGLLDYLDKTEFLPMDIQIGGFRPWIKYAIESRGQHPYDRSFSIRKGEDNEEIAVVMGWPKRGSSFNDSLYQLRKKIEDFGILHKWHVEEKQPPDQGPLWPDNDFFLVLGRVQRQFADKFSTQEATRALREVLAGLPPLDLQVRKEDLYIVGYLDEQLPPQLSWAFPVKDLDGSKIEGLYPRAERRKHPRTVDSGQVQLFCDGSRTAEVFVRLIDVSDTGFQAVDHPLDLHPGQEVGFHHAAAQGRARLIWSYLRRERIESGFEIVEGPGTLKKGTGA